MIYVSTTWLKKPNDPGAWLPGEKIDHEFTEEQIKTLLEKGLIAPADDEQQGVTTDGKISTE